MWADEIRAPFFHKVSSLRLPPDVSNVPLKMRVLPGRLTPAKEASGDISKSILGRGTEQARAVCVHAAHLVPGPGGADGRVPSPWLACSLLRQSQQWAVEGRGPVTPCHQHREPASGSLEPTRLRHALVW